MTCPRLLSLLVAVTTFAPAARAANYADDPKVVRCAVIGPLMSTGLWNELARRFEAATGFRAIVIFGGNKDVIVPAMRRGDVDLITMHASEAIINLVADGHAMDPRPWVRNEHVLIGPTDDPAKVRGLTDAGEAMKRIVAARAPFVVPHGTGAQELYRTAARAAGVTLDETTSLHAPEGPDIARFAASKHAYTIVGRIPFTNGKMERAGLVMMVEGDPRLRRPYLVAIANPRRWPKSHTAAATRLAQFLVEPATQRWIATYDRAADRPPPFFPIAEESQLPR